MLHFFFYFAEIQHLTDMRPINQFLGLKGTVQLGQNDLSLTEIQGVKWGTGIFFSIFEFWPERYLKPQLKMLFESFYWYPRSVIGTRVQIVVPELCYCSTRFLLLVPKSYYW